MEEKNVSYQIGCARLGGVLAQRKLCFVLNSYLLMKYKKSEVIQRKRKKRNKI